MKKLKSVIVTMGIATLATAAFTLATPAAQAVTPASGAVAGQVQPHLDDSTGWD
ncbi:hypothetical protein ACFV0O_02900 [Kitasatospora sp. NPDC059577]|uniref:hypothetical protein n=1 Tax=Kitasatospora sp. NPDC059577 TaxID=3346873 RepID=UPI0036B0926C